MHATRGLACVHSRNQTRAAISTVGNEPKGAARAHRAAPLNVAVVEHQELVRKGIVTALQECADYNVVLSVGTGSALLAACRAGMAVDLVLLEMELPVMDGFAVLARLRERHPQVRALAMAHQPRGDLSARAMRQGACTVLCTGCNAEALCKALRDVAFTGQHMSAPLRELLEQGWRRHNASAGVETRKMDGDALWALLTPREREFLLLYTDKNVRTLHEVALRMGVKESTAEDFRKAVVAKTGRHTKAELVHVVAENGWRSRI